MSLMVHIGKQHPLVGRHTLIVYGSNPGGEEDAWYIIIGGDGDAFTEGQLYSIYNGLCSIFGALGGTEVSKPDPSVPVEFQNDAVFTFESGASRIEAAVVDLHRREREVCRQQRVAYSNLRMARECADSTLRWVRISIVFASVALGSALWMVIAHLLAAVK